MMRPKRISPRVSLLVVFVLLAACNFTPRSSEPQVIIVTATPEAQQIAAAPATATPTPAPTVPPTPTVMPGDALQAAREYLHNGDYAQAVATFRAVLAQPPESYPADVRAAAAYGLGEAALREGLFQEALTALTNFLAQFPADGRVAWAYFLRGDALLGLSQWTAAIEDFEQYLALRAGVIDSYAYERIGDAYYAQALFPQALASYDQAVQAGRSLVPLLALRERVAQRYLNVGQPAQAVAQYDAILAVAQNAGYRAEIMYLAAQALQASGDDAGAFERYRQLMLAYPESGYAYQALQLLLTGGQAIDAELRGRVSYAAEDYNTAVAAFHDYTGQLALSEVPVDIHLLLGRAYRALGNTPAAQSSFQTVIDQFPTSPQFGAALLDQGRTLFWAGNTPAAIEYYLSIANDYPQLTEAAEALWRAGYLYDQQGMTAESVATFERLGRAYPGNEWAQDGLLRAAMAASARNDLATAERLFAALGATGTGEEVAAAYLWLGRLARDNGNTVQAETAFNAAAAADPGGYYSLRARDLLAGRGVFTPPAAYRYEFDEAAALQQAEDWLRATFGITQTGALWPLDPALEADSRLIAGLELWALLSFDEAEEEFYGLLDDQQDNPLGSYQLAIYFRGVGAYPQSIVGAANVLRQANVLTVNAPPFLARLRYPVYYRDLVVPAAEARGVDPLLMFTLIRQESLYDRYATAAAGEKGLTQVIPGTGDYIAQQLNWPDYQHSDLFSPYASVEFGVYYLWEQLNRFDFNVVAGFAGYNAGPGNALSWLEASGGDPDVFIEVITIDSTRRYVQLMYEHYVVYRHLYGMTL